MIVIDIETTGLNPNTCSILSIGALEFEKPDNQFYGECRIFDDAEIDPEGITVCGFSETDIINPKKQVDKELVESFVAWAKNCSDLIWLGHNPATLDRPILMCACERYDIPWIFDKRTVDLHSVIVTRHIQNNTPIPMKNNISALNTNTIDEYVGIPHEPRPHHGLNGAKWEAEAFSRAWYGKNLLSEFIAFPVPDHLRSE